MLASPALRWAGVLVTAILAVMLVLQSVSMTAGYIWKGAAPGFLTGLGRSTAEAMASRAALGIVDAQGEAGRRAAVQVLTREALAREPTNVTAARMRAQLFAGTQDQDAALQWMLVAQALSRRELPVNVWLIEEAARRGDVDGALRRYDQALRTSKSAPTVLYPALVPAANEPAIREPLSRLVAQRPSWWGSYMNVLIGETTRPAVLPVFAERLALSPSDPEHPDFFARIVSRLADGGEYQLARSMVQSVGQMPPAGTISNGSFDDEKLGLPPFAWRLAQNEATYAEFAPRPDRAERALAVTLSDGTESIAASQVVFVLPGSYRLTGEAWLEDGSRDAKLAVNVRCVEGTTNMSSNASFPLAAAPGPFSMPITAPAACQAIELAFGIDSGGTFGDVRMMLDSIQLQRIGTSGGEV